MSVQHWQFLSITTYFWKKRGTSVYIGIINASFKLNATALFIHKDAGYLENIIKYLRGILAPRSFTEQAGHLDFSPCLSHKEIMYPEKTNSKRHVHPSVHSSSIIVKTWKQSKCSSTEECIKKMWHIYTMEYFLTIKKTEIIPFAAICMDLEIIVLSIISQIEKGKYIISLRCGTTKKMIQMNLLTKQK